MAQIKCSHCHQSFDENVMIEDDGHKFCCNGCKNVFKFLQNNGFSEFYTHLGKNILEPVKESGANENFGEQYQNYIKNENGFSKISLVIKGIHCTACIWLNEKVLFNTPGILEANINALNHKATIAWDEREISLNQILKLIRSIGYDAYAYDPSKQEEHITTRRREFYAKLIVGIFGTMNIMWLAVAQYGGYFTGMQEDIKGVLNFAEFVLASVVLFYTGSDFFKGALAAIKNRAQNMDLLIVSGSLMAYIFSIYSMFSRSGDVYFDSVAMIITFVFIGKYLEVLSKKRACDTLDGLNSMIANKVSVKINGKIELKNVNDVAIGEIVVIKPGEMVLIDGVIVNGSASFDYSSLTGESVAIFKEERSEISSGAICLDGLVEYNTNVKFSDSTLNKIINLLENATTKKPYIEKLANEISGKFSSVIMILSLLTFIFWFLQEGSFEHALIVSISVIIIACPCALALATPVSTLVGLTAGFKNGILFKEARILEVLAKCDTVVFDKTGTLTEGRPSVHKFDSFFEFDQNLLYSLLKSSSHPVSNGVCEFLKSKFSELKILNLTNVKSIQAKGVSAQFNDIKIHGGSEKFMRELGFSIDETSEKTNYFFAIDGKIAAKFELIDSIRSEAKECVSILKDIGIGVMMLSGDNEFAAKSVSKELGIDKFKAGCLPDEKAKFVEELVKNGKKVVMVGDGINDSIALSLANVAVCMGSGADVSLKRSDVVLLNDNLKLLTQAVKLSRHTFKIVKQNLAISLIYNALTIPLAMAGYVAPVIAAISMSASSILVVANAMRIKR